MIRPCALALVAWLATLGLFAWLVLAHGWTIATGGWTYFCFFGLLAAGCTAVAGCAARAGRPVGTAATIVAILPFYLLTLVATPPETMVRTGGGGTVAYVGFTSDDYHRFLLDGRLIVAGENPYRVVPAEIPPDSPHHAVAARVNHPQLATFYSPLAEAWFAFIAATGLGRSGILLGNLAAHALAILLLGRMGVIGWRRLLFALNPLLLVEGTIGFHFDPMVMVLLLGTAFCLEQERRTGAAAFWASATGLKLFPLLFAPIVLRGVGWRRMAVAGGILAAIHVPFANRETLEVYRAFLEMSFNASPVAALLPPLARPVLLLAVIGWFTFRPGSRGAAVFWPVLALLVLASTVHPWYVLWILPLAFLAPRERWPVIGWSYAVVAAYAILVRLFQEGVSRSDAPVAIAVWGLFLTALLIVGCRRLLERSY